MTMNYLGHNIHQCIYRTDKGSQAFFLGDLAYYCSLGKLDEIFLNLKMVLAHPKYWLLLMQDQAISDHQKFIFEFVV